MWEDRALGPQQQRCSNVSYARSQVRGPHNHIFVSQTIYFTLLHSLKTRLFMNPVLNNPTPSNPNPNRDVSDHAQPMIRIMLYHTRMHIICTYA